MTLVGRWTIYLTERSPPAALLLVSAGIALAPMAFAQTMDWRLLALGTAGVFTLLVLMRLGDEIKDYQTDVVVHPERPLPRGLLSLTEAKLGMQAVTAVIAVLAGVGTLRWSPAGGIVLAATTGYIWLMYKEFFAAHTLAGSPLANALLHQLIVFPLYGWPGAFAGAGILAGLGYPAWLLYNFGASMTFEMCRKLDPQAHTLQTTYLLHYGSWKTAAIVSGFIAVSIGAGFAAGQQAWLLPVQLPLLLSVLLLPLRPRRFKLTEALSAISAIWHIWAPATQWAASVLSIP